MIGTRVTGIRFFAQLTSGAERTRDSLFDIHVLSHRRHAANAWFNPYLPRPAVSIAA